MGFFTLLLMVLDLNIYIRTDSLAGINEINMLWQVSSEWLHWPKLFINCSVSDTKIKHQVETGREKLKQEGRFMSGFSMHEN